MLLLLIVGDLIGLGLRLGDFTASIDDEFEENSELDETFDCIDIFASGRIVSSGGKFCAEKAFACDVRL